MANKKFEVEATDCNPWHEQVALLSAESGRFVAGVMVTVATAESMGEDSDCDAIDILMEAINYLLKQENGGIPMGRDEAIDHLDPLISLLEEGVIDEIH